MSGSHMYVYNLVESCDYGDSNDRIIRDVLIIGCNYDKAKDKIVRQGEKIKLQEVIEILQLEDSTRQTLTVLNEFYRAEDKLCVL